MPATVEYLVGLRQLCDEHGLLLLFDSVQCGHFRSGRFQSYQRILEDADSPEAAAFMPDGVSMAKSMGARRRSVVCLCRPPLTRCCRRGRRWCAHWCILGGREARRSARPRCVGQLWLPGWSHRRSSRGCVGAGMHGTTYGGNPLACAVGHKVIEIIERDRLEENVRAVGAQLDEGLRALQSVYPTVIADSRGLGLMRGLVLHPKDGIAAFAGQEASASAQFVNKLHEAGMLTVGSGDQVVRLLPPFNTTAAEAEEALDKIEGVAKSAAG